MVEDNLGTIIALGISCFFTGVGITIVGMMLFWKDSPVKREETPVEKESPIEEKPVPEQTLIESTDNPFERAEKTLQILGIRGHTNGKLAEVFMGYQQLDKTYWENSLKKPNSHYLGYPKQKRTNKKVTPAIVKRRGRANGFS